MSGPIPLSAAQLSAVYRAAAPIDPDRRAEFLQRVADELQRTLDLGDGQLYRVLRDAQVAIISPPSQDGRRGPR